MYKHTHPSEKKIPLPTALLLNSSDHISLFLRWAMSHEFFLNTSSGTPLSAPAIVVGKGKMVKLSLCSIN